jgi:hypothetical protein
MLSESERTFFMANYKFTTQLTEALYNDQLERIEGLKDPLGKLYYLKISEETFNICKGIGAHTRSKNGDELRGFFCRRRQRDLPIFDVAELARNFDWQDVQFSSYELGNPEITRFCMASNAIFTITELHLFGVIFIFTRKKILLFPVIEDSKLPLAKAKICRIDIPEKVIIHNTLYCQQ